MAKLKGPLFSLAAHGTLGGAITYSQRKTHNHARFQKKQMDYVNDARQAQREQFLVSNALWKTLSAEEKGYWRQIAAQGYADIP